MAIRPATYDPDDPTGGPDVQLILSLLALVPNPPNETVEGVGGTLDSPRRIVFIDDIQRTACRLAPRVDDQVVVITWWLWDGTGDFTRRMFPVLRAAIMEVVTQHPGAATWTIYGDFHGAGNTGAQKLADSEAKARAVKGLVLDDADVVLAPSAANPGMMRLQATVAQALTTIPESP